MALGYVLSTCGVRHGRGPRFSGASCGTARLSGPQGRPPWATLSFALFSRLTLATALILAYSATKSKAELVFSEPVIVSNINMEGGALDPSISSDGLELYLKMPWPGNNWDIFVARRNNTNQPFDQGTNLGPVVNDISHVGDPCISADQCELYFGSSNKSPQLGAGDIWVTTRKTKNDPWGIPVNLGTPVNDIYGDGDPSISSDGLELYFYSQRDKVGYVYLSEGVFVSKRKSKRDPWQVPKLVLKSVSQPSISFDGRMLYVSASAVAVQDESKGNRYDTDIYVTTRKTNTDNWSPLVNLGQIINSETFDDGASISSDGYTLYFNRWPTTQPLGSGRSSGKIYVTHLNPTVDTNKDGAVNFRDFAEFAKSWRHTNVDSKHVANYAPPPFGDDIIDFKDLAVFCNNFPKNSLISHWTFDETQGNTARDSMGNKTGIVYGNPTWEPGIINGSLSLDGIDDYVETPFVLNPDDGPFTAYAYAKGVIPEGTIISQEGNVWLGTDSAGRLTTSLKPATGRLIPFQSLVPITDGEWHDVGIMWSDNLRTLYIDGKEVAKDTKLLGSLTPSASGLLFGAGDKANLKTYWAGSIDDIRIYNTAHPNIK